MTRIYDSATLGKGRLHKSETTGTGGSLSTTDAYDARLQNYDYDELNRLTAVAEVPEGSTEQWKQAYTYDRYGNRTINTGVTYGGVNNKSFNVDTATNRLVVPGGQSGTMSYDAAGNLTTDSYGGGYGAMTYNADNKIVAAQDSLAGWSYYTYNADGQRVRRKIGNVETWAIYGMDGELVAEYSASGATNSPQKEYGYRNGQLLVSADANSGGSRVNVALASNGATATASSIYNALYPASKTNDGNRASVEWNDAAPPNSFPDWVEIAFSGSKTIDEIDVITLQDNYASPIEPTETMTFTVYGLTGYDVQYWTGSAWATVSGGSITSNNKVWKKITFSPITTPKIRILTNASPDGWSRLVEVEAWTTGTGTTGGVHWLVADQLGTPRMVFDQTGSLANVKRHDYLPFGEELMGTISGRSGAQGYGGGDGVRQQFTSQERDIETGLDYFNARYYAPTQARFASADSVSGSPSNPQTLNLYSYTSNNPLNYSDPTGHMSFPAGGTEPDLLNPNPRGRFCMGDEKPKEEPPPRIVLPIPNPAVPDPPLPIDQKLLDRDTKRAIQTGQLLGYIRRSPIDPFVHSMIFGLDGNGKVTVELEFSDQDAAIDALENDKERFMNAGMGSKHVEELGESSAEDVLDYRSYTRAKNRLGPKSLQIDIGKTTKRARADVDNTNPAQDVHGAVVHLFEMGINKGKRIVKN